MKNLPRLVFWLGLLFWLVSVQGSLAQPLYHIPTRFLPGDTATLVAANNQDSPAVARGSNHSLVVWSDDRAVTGNGYEAETSRDIYGLRLDNSGNPVDALPVAIATAPASQENPQVAWNGSNWLVMFESYTTTGFYYQKSLAFVRVSPAGQPLDAQPIPLHGPLPTMTAWSLTNNGTNWVVAFQGTAANLDLSAMRISLDGVVLDPPTRSLVPGTYYMRSNLRIACTNGTCLLTYNGLDNTGGVLFDSSLNVLSGGPFTMLSVPNVSALESNGTQFYMTWTEQQPDFSLAVKGTRVNTAGQKLDGAGVNISDTNHPQADTITDVVWTGTLWKITWGHNDGVRLARVDSAGQLLDPGGVTIAGPTAGFAAAAANGTIHLVWMAYTNANNDIHTATIANNNTASPNQTLSLGAPMQTSPDVATSGNGYMVVFRSSTGTQHRIMAQPLAANGDAILAEPVQLDSGDLLYGPGTPSVAWNGSLYLVSWGNSQGIVAQRIQADGTKIDTNPFVVMPQSFGPADVAAIGDTFLVTGNKYGPTPEVIYALAARVRGTDGAVLDTTAINLGSFYARTPAVVNLAGRWLVVWHNNWSHDNSIADTLMTFVNPDGSKTSTTGLYGPFSMAGGNGIFKIALAASGNTALMVQSVELSSGVETDIVGVLVNADGTLQTPSNLTPWRGNQYLPTAAWDGTHFIVMYQDQRNRFSDLDMLDARGDLFGMRISVTGTVLDPAGFLFANSPVAEAYPTVTAHNGLSLMAASFMRNESPYVNHRIGYEQRGSGGNQWPVAVASANPAVGTVPLPVNFSAAGSTDPDGTITAYAWDFGDGATANTANPSHTYTGGGPFVATLTVTDNGGAQTTNTILVDATWPNQFPIAQIHADVTSGNAPLTVIFDAYGSYDPDGTLVNFLWTYSDGSQTYGTLGTETYTVPGVYTVTLTVYDDHNVAGTDTMQIMVTEPGSTYQVFMPMVVRP